MLWVMLPDLKATEDPKAKGPEKEPGADASKETANKASGKKSAKKTTKRAPFELRKGVTVMLRFMNSNGIPKTTKAKVVAVSKKQDGHVDVAFDVDGKTVTYQNVRSGSPKDNKLVCPRWWPARQAPEEADDSEQGEGDGEDSES